MFEYKKLGIPNIWFALLVLCSFGLMLSTQNVSGNTSVASENAQESSSQIYLPVVLKRHSRLRPLSVFGVEINMGKVNQTIDYAVEANASWVRYNGIQWDIVESVKGNIDWSQLATFEEEIKALSSEGFSPIVIIRGTPEWARMTQYPDSTCSPVRQDALVDYANFVREVVQRYSQAPYYVEYWELGNEPDVDPNLVTPTSAFGCWGNESDPYYGGSYYATMLKQVYPAIKAADPSAQVLIGGLLLDCDPTNPPAGTDCKPAKFLEGILINGGGDYFDMVAYHAYSYWGSVNIGHDWDLMHSSWQHRGGALLGKLDFIETVLNTYGFGDKDIIMDEGVLLCSDNFDICDNTGFYHSQANYALRLYARAKTTNLEGVIWYTLNGPGWRFGGLLDGNQQPRLVFNTFKLSAQWLAEATYSGTLSDGSNGLEGYEFYHPSAQKRYQIYWANDNSSHAVAVPDGMIAVYDKLGNVITPVGTTIAVDFEPVIIEMNP